MIREIVGEFHKMINKAIKNKQIKLEGGDIKDLASEVSAALVTKLTDKELSNEERNRAANSLVAISKVEDDLGGY